MGRISSNSQGKTKMKLKNKRQPYLISKTKNKIGFKNKKFKCSIKPVKKRTINEKSHAPKTNLCSPADESSSEDCESDAFSQLVSSFSCSKNNSSFLSDDSDSEEESSEMSSRAKNLSDKVNTNILNEENNSPTVLTDSDSDLDGPTCSYTSESQEIKRMFTLTQDPFEGHFQFDLDDNLFHAVSSMPKKSTEVIKHWPLLGQITFTLPQPSTTCSSKQLFRIDDNTVYAKQGTVPNRIEHVFDKTWDMLFIKSQIQKNILKSNVKHGCQSVTEEDQLNNLQKELFSIINNYQDLYFSDRNLHNGEEVRFIYCLHAINHVLKTRLKVVHHNTRLANKQDPGDIPEEFRDQGLIRPKVLILLPFRNSALRVVEMLASILLDEGDNILNKKRFFEEFTAGEIAMPRKNPKPEDYEQTFAGDTDDNFKIGISLTKKSLKLYADFYSSDIIIASPLGLRVLVGAEGQADRDYDFLASIEILVLDQAEVILMQNWDHLLHLWDHLHLQPKESHGTNFGRVRQWALSGRSRYFRQTLVFSSSVLPQISALFSRKCHNYAGSACVINPVKTGSICQIVLQLPQVFNRIESSSATESINARFDYFINKVLPQYKESLMSHTVIYVPSYFDYVKIRNHFKKESISFVQICEYSKDGKVARARDMFFHSSAHFLLYSERFHFFRRIRLKGIRHIVFYQPPTIPHFYSELCNLMQSEKHTEEGSLSVTVLYTKYDVAQLAAVVGSERAGRMMASEQLVHMFMTGD